MDLPRFLELALQELESGAPAKCLGICDEILAVEPGLVHAIYLRGCAAWELGDIERSIDDLGVVVTNHPEHLQAAYYLGRSLRRAGRFEDALAPLQAALGAEGLATRAHYELAACLGQLRRRPEAIDHYEKILARQPDHAQAAASLAATLERENRLDEAAAWVSKALASEPTNSLARMTRATLARRSGEPAAAAAQLQALIPELDNPVNEAIAWNQLGQCHEAQEAWPRAWDAFSRSNRVLEQGHPAARPDPRGPHGMETLARIGAWLETNPVESWTMAAADAGGIAFLVGFPRSGTTLLDRMLRTHPDIEVLEEKSLFAELHRDWATPGVLEALAGINDAQIDDARNIYRRAMARHRQRPESGLVIDKLPLNLSCLFLVHRLFPAAPVIFLQRHPLDACVSCFFQAFELGAAMGYFLDIGQTAQYYDRIMQVAAQSMQQIGNPLHVLRYEDLVTQPQPQLDALLRFLGLQALDAADHRSASAGDGASNTPSYQQVSQPLYTRSIGRWRHYAGQLEGVMPLLEPWVGRLGYE